jgi:FAD/FMN-containing dehydrogenase
VTGRGNPAAVLAEIAALLGPAGIITEPSEKAGYERGARYGAGRALCVVRPKTTAEVQQVVRWAHRHELQLIPQGANTGLVAAASPDSTATQVIVSLERMRSEIALDADNRTVTVSAGVLLQSLNDRLAREGLWFPIDLGANPSIGGMIAANTGGARLLKYGDVRRQLLGLEVVLADSEGTRLDLMRGLRKDNTGVDLKQLFVGTSGAFGIITGAILEVHPLPRQRACALLIPRSAEAATDVLRGLEQRCGELLTSFEGMSRAAMECVFRFRPQVSNPFAQSGVPEVAVLVELSSGLERSQLDLDATLESVLAELADGSEPPLTDALMGRAEQSWQLRHALSDALREAGQVIAFDISVRRSLVQAFRRRMIDELRSAWAHLRVCDFGHWGDGGLHFNIVWPHGCGVAVDAETVQSVRDRVYQTLVREFDGSFSAEHGIGPYNRAIYEQFTAPGQLKLAGSLQRLVNPAARLGVVNFGLP